jgi:acetylornithine deacetylase/succinyl-diaminopimelate desuccinylase-like protein
MSTNTSQLPIYQRPAELLQHLIRFDTTNPPGNEAACVHYIKSILDEAGIESRIIARDTVRPNLVARVAGRGDAPPLLLQGHVDVVTTANQQWQHPPFDGDIIDGYVWGRGALDMKGGVVMMLCAFLRAWAEAVDLPGDVILAIVSDEEVGDGYGARYLVEEHPHLFKNVRYALGEFGGFSLQIAGRTFYPIQVLEKHSCKVRAIVRGPGGHGSSPVRGGAMAKLGRMLQQLDQQRLPAHIIPVVRQMIETIAQALPAPVNEMLLQLLDPARTDAVLDQLGQVGQLFDPLLHNVVNPTIVRGGDKINVIPARVDVEMDGRLLPGYNASDFLGEIRSLVGDDIELEVIKYDPGLSEANMGLFDTLAAILREADPEAIPLPQLLQATTDGLYFGQVGIQCYGFLPMKLPADFNFVETIHAADERIPLAALVFGTDAIFQALHRFHR